MPAVSAQPEPGRQQAALAPRLVIDARAAAIDPGHRLLGLTLLRRLALAARRSGYGTIHVAADAPDVARLRHMLAAIDDVHIRERMPEPDTAARTVYAPSGVLGERAWLEAAADAPVADGGALPAGAGVVVYGRGALLPAHAPPAGHGEANGGLRAMPFGIGSDADLPAAERRLLRSLVKSTDGFMSKYFERPLSIPISRRLAATKVMPNHMTIFSAVIGMGAAPFFLSPTPLWQTVGALFFLVHAVLDGCDGELARLRFQESRFGGVLDFWGDNVVHSTIFGCMAMGWALSEKAAWPLALGALAVFGTLGSAGFVYWRLMRAKSSEGRYTSIARAPSGRLVALLDTLSRRDFIYLVLALSLFGKAAWFVILAAVGAPIFFLLLLLVASRERTTPQAALG